MRVLYLMQYFVPPSGAWSTRSYEFARELQARGHDVTVITSTGMLPAPYKDFTTTTVADIDGIRCVIIPAPYATGMSLLERVKGYLRYNLSAFWVIMQQSTDVVFASSAPLTIAIPAIGAKIYHRIPMVFEVRDLWPELPIAIGALRSPVLKALARLLEWIAYHSSDEVIALSPSMAQGVRARGLGQDRVAVIPNFSDVEFFSSSTNDGTWVRQMLSLDADNPLVIYAGSYGLLNNVEYLIYIAEETKVSFPQLKFLIVGQGIKKKEMIRLAQQRGVLNQNLWIWDSIPKTQVPGLLAAATVATSLFIPLEPMWKNSANKFFDALAAGKPVVINYGGWQAEIIEQTGAGLVLPPDNPREGALLLAQFLQDPQRLDTAAHNAKRLAVERFSRDQAASAFVNLLESVVERKSKR